MRTALAALLTAMVAASPAFAAKSYPGGGSTCRGVDCRKLDESSVIGGSGAAGRGQPSFELSRGAYRVPFENGTKVYVSQDIHSHSGPGKVDLLGGGVPGVALPGTPRVVAAAAGTIMKIEDGRKRSQSRKSDVCNNNFVWIAHDNGEWTKYTHMKQHSTRKKAGLKEGDRVQGGTFLGDMGSVGCSNPAHLHFEVLVPKKSSPRIDPDHGGIAGTNRDPYMCGLKDGDTTFRKGRTYEALAGPGEVTPGAGEVIRTGMPYRNYACFLHRAADAGYQPVLVDFFEQGRDLLVNVVVRPKESAWMTRSSMTAGQLRINNQTFKNDGYRLAQLESYLDGRDVRYAAIWDKSPRPATEVYWGYSVSAHQAKVEDLKARGYVPRNLSVVSPGSGNEYTALWEKADGGWSLRSTLTLAEYRDLARSKDAEGLEVAFLSARTEKKNAFFSAIWKRGMGSKTRRRTDLGPKDFEAQWELARKLGLKTYALAAHEVDGRVRYSGVFSH